MKCVSVCSGPDLEVWPVNQHLWKIRDIWPNQNKKVKDHFWPSGPRITGRICACNSSMSSYLVPPLHSLLQPVHSSHSDHQLQYLSKQSLICLVWFQVNIRIYPNTTRFLCFLYIQWIWTRAIASLGNYFARQSLLWNYPTLIKWIRRNKPNK